MPYRAVNVGQAIVTSLEFIGQLFVVDAQAVKHGGMEIIDVDRVLGDVE